MGRREISPNRNLKSGRMGILRPPRKQRSIASLVCDVIGVGHFIAANALLLIIDEAQARAIMYSQNIFESSPLVELVLRFMDSPVYRVYLKFLPLPKEIAPKYMVAEGIIILSSILYAYLARIIIKLISLPFKG